MAQNEYDGLENGVLQWIPHRHDIRKHTKEQFGVGVQQARRHGIKSPPSAEMNSQFTLHRHPRPQRTRNQSNWVSNGPGMQAIFLGSNKRSCGTGVFIPRTEGTDKTFSKKPACSTVLLPSRVIQTLNLNVHELGQQKPQLERRKTIAKKIDDKLAKEEEANGDYIYLPQEIFLPKEWTY